MVRPWTLQECNTQGCFPPHAIVQTGGSATLTKASAALTAPDTPEQLLSKQQQM